MAQREIYRQAFRFGPANCEFCQSFLIRRAKIRRSSRMSWFHINLKWNDWLREALWFNGFVENICNICSIFITVTNQLIPTFQVPNSYVALLTCFAICFMFRVACEVLCNYCNGGYSRQTILFTCALYSTRKHHCLMGFRQPYLSNLLAKFREFFHAQKSEPLIK